MLSKRSLEGYLLIDHSSAPGAGMVGPGRKFESATITCSHCQRVVILNPDRSRSRGHCRRCDHYICDNPACNIECLPFNKYLDTMQEEAIRNLGKDTING